MPSYRRLEVQGAPIFLTVVTHERRAILCTDMSRGLLRKAIGDVRALHPFRMVACVLMPDHLHMLWQLPEEDEDFSTLLGGIKHAFTRAYLAAGGEEGHTSPSRQRHRNRGVWQKRFHDHVIRDDRDLERHIDYIHYNPNQAWPRASGARLAVVELPQIRAHGPMHPRLVWA